MDFTKQSTSIPCQTDGRPTLLYDTIEKIPSDTLKRHPKMDLNKDDLLKLLSYLEGELQARDLSIAALKAEKASQVLFQAKYGQFGLRDAFYALKRDSDDIPDRQYEESALKIMYENQLGQLEKLITTQRSAQRKMQEQLISVERNYHKVCANLIEEKRKHAQDTAQGDDVTYMLEKERERLKQELDFEKCQRRKTEKEVEKLLSALKEEKNLNSKHKYVSLCLIRERKQILADYGEIKKHKWILQKIFEGEMDKNDETLACGLNNRNKCVMPSATKHVETKISAIASESEHLATQLHMAKAQNHHLLSEVNDLQQQLKLLQLCKDISVKEKVKKNTGEILDVSIGDTSVASPLSSTHKQSTAEVLISSQTSDLTRQGLNHHDNHLTSDSQKMENVMMNKVESKMDCAGQMQIPKQTLFKPLHNTLQDTSSSTVLREAFGTNYSTSVNTSEPNKSLISSYRKSSPAGKGNPPPIPPNKPQISMNSLHALSPKSCSQGNPNPSFSSHGRKETCVLLMNMEKISKFSDASSFEKHASTPVFLDADKSSP